MCPELQHSSTVCERLFLISWIHLFNVLIKVISARAPDSCSRKKIKVSSLWHQVSQHRYFFLQRRRMRHTCIKKRSPYPNWTCFHLTTRPLLSRVMKPRRLWVICSVSLGAGRRPAGEGELHHSNNAAENPHKKEASPAYLCLRSKSMQMSFMFLPHWTLKVRNSCW